MRRVVAIAFIVAAYSLPLFSQEAEETPPFVTICKIEGMIDDGNAVLVERVCRESNGAQAIIFIIDTPGGRVDSAINISNAILNAPARTIAYIEGMGAISAGALISFSCDDIIMTPASNIGAAAPVTISSEGMMPLGEKEVSFVRAKMASLAEANGHNPDLAMAMVDKDIELVAYPTGVGTYEVRASNAGQDPNEPTAFSNAKGDDAIDQLFENLPEDMEPVKDFLKDAARTVAEEVQKADDEHQQKAEADDPLAEAPVVDEYGGRIVLGKGKLLTLTPKEAQAYGLIPTTADSIDQAMAFYEMTGVEKRYIVMTWSEELFRFLTNPMISGLLLMLGLGGLYVEIRTPGFGLPGIVGLVSLALFFGARTVIGMSEWIDLLLMAVGVGLIAVEIFVLPGFGIAGVAGFICVLAGIYMSLTFNGFSIPQYEWEFDRLREAGYTVLTAAIMLAVLAAVLAKVFPHTPLYRRMVLTGNQNVELGYVVQGQDDVDEFLGKAGVATSALRPAGRGRFENKTLQVVTRAEFIEEGTPIIIVQVDGNRYVVDRMKEKAV